MFLSFLVIYTLVLSLCFFSVNLQENEILPKFIMTVSYIPFTCVYSIYCNVENQTLYQPNFLYCGLILGGV